MHAENAPPVWPEVDDDLCRFGCQEPPTLGIIFSCSSSEPPSNWQKYPSIACHILLQLPQRAHRCRILDIWGLQGSGIMSGHNLPKSPSPLSALSALLSSTAAAAKQRPTCQRSRRRQFSSTPIPKMTKLRSEMFSWLNTRGKNFQYPVEKETNYLTDYDRDGFRKEEEDEASEGETDPSGLERGKRSRYTSPRHPFPLNEHFVSQPILSERLREEIWRRVKVDKKSVRIVSIELGVEMRRVGAVVRLVELEKQWRAEVSFNQRSPRFVWRSLSRDEQPKFD
jgi:Eukaryotic mitochondrial regulator protein